MQTPLRISFLGGGSDFADYYLKNGGFVINTAIDKYIFVILKERFDDMIYVNYSAKEIVDNVDDIQHNLIREALKITGISKGIELTTLADIPSEGSGLGSSSAVTVGLLQALSTYKGEVKTQEELAVDACHIEIDLARQPIGKQDQYIASYGNMRSINFNKDGSVNPEKLHISESDKGKLNDNLMLFYTNRTREASSVLNEQTAKLAKNIDNLHELVSLAKLGEKCLLQGTFDEFGEILNKSWIVKKQLANNITNPEIDNIYDTAIKAGATGGKITGAGGGGFLLLYCPKLKQDNVRSALKNLRELSFSFERDGTKVMLNTQR